MGESYCIGVDGGGTKTIAVAARPDGTVLAVQRGEGINHNNIGMDRARNNLKAIIDRLTQDIDGKCEEITIGSAALDLPASEELTRRFAGTTFDPNRIDLQSDAYITLMGCTQGQPGLIVICGTGSILLMADAKGNQHVRGGWGWLLGDPGSGYSLAVAGLFSAIRSWENVGKKTLLCEKALEHFHCAQPRQLIDAIYAPTMTQSEIARFGEKVLVCCEEKDEEALRILHENMRLLSENAAEMISSAPEAHRVGLWGSILTKSPCAREALSDALFHLCPAAQMVETEVPPELGAILHSLKKRGILTETVFKRLKETYQNGGMCQ